MVSALVMQKGKTAIVGSRTSLKEVDHFLVLLVLWSIARDWSIC